MRRITLRSFVIGALIAGLAALGGALAYFSSTGVTTASGSVGTLASPTNVAAPSPSSASVSLSWSAPATPNSSFPTYFAVQRSSDGGSTWVNAGGTCPTGSSAQFTNTACTDSVSTSGSYVYRVIAYWQSWTSTSAQSASVSVDAAAPTTSTTSPQYDNTGSITVGYTAADTGGSHLKSIQLYVKTPGGNSYSATGSPVSISTDSASGNFPAYTTSGNGTYSFYALATDNAGNTTTVPGSAQTTTIEDNLAPTTTTSSPTYDHTGSITVGYTAADTGGSHLKSIQLYVKTPGGNSYSATGSPVSISTDSASGNFPAYTTSGNGTYSFYALATDNAGNTTTVPGSAQTTTTEDNVAPSSAISFPAASTSYNSSGWSAGCNVSPFSVSNSICGTASDALSGVKQVQVSIQQGTGYYWNPSAGSFSSSTEQKMTASGTTSWTVSFAAGNFPADGSYTVRVYATDNAGNTQSAASSTTFTIDNTPPSVSLTKVNGTTVTFPYSTSGSVTSIGGACGTAAGDSSTVSWSVSGSATQSGNATCTSGSWSATLSPTLANGSYTLSATQTDNAGNTGTSGSRSLTIGTPAPTVVIDSNTGKQLINGGTFTSGTGTYLIAVYCSNVKSACNSTSALASVNTGSGTPFAGTAAVAAVATIGTGTNTTGDCLELIQVTGSGTKGTVTVNPGNGGTVAFIEVLQLPTGENITQVSGAIGTQQGTSPTNPVIATLTNTTTSEITLVGITDGSGSTTVTPPSGMTQLGSYQSSPNSGFGADMGVYFDPTAQSSATFGLSTTASEPWATIAAEIG